MTFGLIIPSVQAAPISSPAVNYDVSSASVQLSSSGSGSFTVTAYALGQPPINYSGLELWVRIPDGVNFTCVFNPSGDISPYPTKTSGAPAEYQDYFITHYANTNKFSGAIACTFNVTYTGNSPQTITISQALQTVLNGQGNTDYYVSSSSRNVTLVPYVSGGGDTVYNASLTSLSVNTGPLSPGFTSDNYGPYSATVPNSTASVTVNATPSDTSATVSISCKGASYLSGGAIPLDVGANTITVTVTTGSSSATYTVIVNRDAPPASSDWTLSKLSLSSGTQSISLVPVFDPNTLTYTAKVDNNVDSVSVTAEKNNSNAKAPVIYTVNPDTPVANPIPLNVSNNNNIYVKVTAEDGTTKTYQITVTRDPSHDATLKSLALSGGWTLYPAFKPVTTDYTTIVTDESVTVTPTTSDASATFIIYAGDSRVQTGDPISLALGEDKAVRVEVTAGDGTSKKTYQITITRQVPSASNDATLKSLTLNNGTPDIKFKPDTTDYTATVNSGSVVVNAVTSNDGATFIIYNGDISDSNNMTDNPITLKSGLNTIHVVVVAADKKTTKTYTIGITYTPPTDGGSYQGGNGGNNTTSGGGGGSVTAADTAGKATVTETIDKQQTPTAGVGLPFTDVHESDWFYGNVLYCWQNGLVKGTSDTAFSPNMAITRGMVVTILYRAEGAPDTASPTSLNNPFSDVAEGAWYTDAIKWAADKGIVKGYPDGTYQPNKSISRQEMAAIISRYSDFAGIELPAAREYTGFNDDAAIADYAKGYVKNLYTAGIIEGMPNNMFGPLGTATRAQFAAMMNRLLTANG